MNVRLSKAHPPKPKAALAATERDVRWAVPSGGLQKPGWRITDRTFDEIVRERRELADERRPRDRESADRFDVVARGRRR